MLWFWNDQEYPGHAYQAKSFSTRESTERARCTCRSSDFSALLSRHKWAILYVYEPCISCVLRNGYSSVNFCEIACRQSAMPNDKSSGGRAYRRFNLRWPSGDYQRSVRVLRKLAAERKYPQREQGGGAALALVPKGSWPRVLPQKSSERRGYSPAIMSKQA